MLPPGSLQMLKNSDRLSADGGVPLTRYSIMTRDHGYSPGFGGRDWTNNGENRHKLEGRAVIERNQLSEGGAEKI